MSAKTKTTVFLVCAKTHAVALYNPDNMNCHLLSVAELDIGCCTNPAVSILQTLRIRVNGRSVDGDGAGFDSSLLMREQNVSANGNDVSFEAIGVIAQCGRERISRHPSVPDFYWATVDELADGMLHERFQGLPRFVSVDQRQFNWLKGILNNL